MKDVCECDSTVGWSVERQLKYDRWASDRQGQVLKYVSFIISMSSGEHRQGLSRKWIEP